MALFDINDQPNIPITAEALKADGWTVLTKDTEDKYEFFHTANKHVPCKNKSGVLTTLVMTIYFDAPYDKSIYWVARSLYKCEGYKFDQYWTQEHRDNTEFPVETNYKKMRRTKIKSFQHLEQTINRILKTHDLVKV